MKHPFPLLVVVLLVSTSFIGVANTLEEFIEESQLLTELIIEGPTLCKVGVEYEYSIYLIEPEDDVVWFRFNFGDGEWTDWIGPYESDEKIIWGMSWPVCGVYTIQVEALCNGSYYNASITVTVIDYNIIYVDDDNTEGPWDGTIEHPYLYIRDGIDKATDGDTVFVYNGTYYEHIVINLSINLIGEDSDTTIIDGNKDGNVVYVSSDNVSIEGFTIQNSSDDNGGIKLCSNYSNIQKINLRNNYFGILLQRSSHNNIFNNTITMSGDVGIQLTYWSKYNVISGNIISWSNRNGILTLGFSNYNTISDNIIENLEDGILIGSDNNIISDNIIRDNHYGISVPHTKNNIISNNTIKNNLVGMHIQGSDSINSVITNNTISYCNSGIILSGGLKNAVISENNITSNANGIEVMDSSNVTIVSNHIFNNGVGINLASSSDNAFSENSINGNFIGINLKNSESNEIRCNNFKKNTFLHAIFYNSQNIIWSSNYWNRPRILPKPIFGVMKTGTLPILRLQFDWRPALKPYDIEM